jgi:hypothetical protein
MQFSVTSVSPLAAYIRYLRQFVPQDKWLPPSTSVGGSGYEESEASAFDEAVEEAPTRELVSHPTGPAYMMQAPMYGMQYMQHGGAQMQGMTVGMVPSGLPMGPLHSPMYYFPRDGRPMPAMAPINMGMGGMQFAMAPMSMGPAPAEDAGSADNRKRKHFSTDGSRSGTSDSTGGPAVDATAFGSIRKPLQVTKEESGSASAEMFVQRSSHRRRRKVGDDESLDSEDNDRATQVHESETAFLDALASIAASTSQDYTAAVSTSSTREPVSEFKVHPTGTSNVSPRSLVSPATHTTMEGLSHLTLSRSHTAPMHMGEPTYDRYTGQAYTYRHPGQVPPAGYMGEHRNYAMLPDVIPHPSGRPLPKISQTHARMGDTHHTADPSYGGSADPRFVHDPARMPGATLRRTSNYGDQSHSVY